MLFHLKRNPDIKAAVLGFDWLDILAIQPEVLFTYPDSGEKDWDFKRGAKDWLIKSTFYARSPDGFEKIMEDELSIAIDLTSAKEDDCEYYMAEKEGRSSTCRAADSQSN